MIEEKGRKIVVFFQNTPPDSSNLWFGISWSKGDVYV